MSGTISNNGFKASYYGVDIVISSVSVDNGIITFCIDKQSMQDAIKFIDGLDYKMVYPEVFNPIV